MATAAADKVTTQKVERQYVRAAFVPGTYNEESRTIEMVWSTGHKGLRRSWYMGNYYEELSMDPAHVRMGRLQSGRAPFLKVHNSYSLDSVMGVIDSASLVNGEGRATVRLSEREDVAKFIPDIRAGILPNISVGYDVYTYEVIESVDEKIPTYRAIDWEPAELSLVPIGFDPDASTRKRSAEDECPFTEVQIITTRGVAATAEEKVMTPEEIAAAKAADEAKRAADIKAAGDAAVVAERARSTEIRTAVQKAGLKDGAALADKMISDGVAVDAARAQIIDAMAAQQAAEQPNTRTQHGIEVGKSGREMWAEDASSWLFEKAGTRAYAEKAGATVKVAKDMRGMTLVDLARQALELDGVNTRGMDRMQLVGAALTRGGYNGTGDFSVLLENVMHKTLLGSFATVPDTWRRFCAVGSVSDFRAHNRYRMGSFGTLDAKNEHGEFKNKQIPDGAKESISIGTKGNIIGLTREAIINDDMGVFTSIATRFGRMAGLSIESDVYASLALNSGLGPDLNDGNPIFHDRGAGKNNITTSAALTAANLDLDRQALASLKDLSGNEFLSLSLSALLVSLTLGSTARQINAMEFDEESNKQNKRPNVSRGLFSDIIDTPRLTGNRRYMFADPSIAPVLEVAFLDGQQTPFMDIQNGWRVDGVEWKIRLDYGVAGVDYVGALTNAGG